MTTPCYTKRLPAASPPAGICLTAIGQIMNEEPFLAGEVPRSAELHAAPMFAFAVQAPDAVPLPRRHPKRSG